MKLVKYLIAIHISLCPGASVKTMDMKISYHISQAWKVNYSLNCIVIYHTGEW